MRVAFTSLKRSTEADGSFDIVQPSQQHLAYNMPKNSVAFCQLDGVPGFPVTELERSYSWVSIVPSFIANRTRAKVS